MDKFASLAEVRPPEYPLPRRGAKKLARVDDQFAAGEPGLVDSQEYPFLKKPGLEYYTTKEKRNEMSLYNPD